MWMNQESIMLSQIKSKTNTPSYYICGNLKNQTNERL